MNSTPVVSDQMLANTIREVPGPDFTTLDFQDVFQRLYPAEWEALVGKYGTYGGGRFYTVGNFFAHRIQQYSWKDQSVLKPHTAHHMDPAKDFRKPTESEKKRTGGRVIAIFRKAKRTTRRHS